MSLVGPRPERPEFVEVLADAIPGYLHRLDVPPGVTGLAQVNLPPDTDLDSVRRKLVLDLEYARTGSMLLDLRLIACTVLRVLGLRSGRAVWLMGLERTVALAGEPQGDEEQNRDWSDPAPPGEESNSTVAALLDTIALTDTVEMQQFVDTMVEDDRCHEESEEATPGAIARVMARRPR
jgi:hypothetical protein